MRIAVISCWKYRDAWGPMFDLLDKFWPENEWPCLISDKVDNWSEPFFNVRDFYEYDGSWCKTLAKFIEECFVEDPVLLFQEDFFINAPVHQNLIDHALEQMVRRDAGMVRLYPCPGSDDDYGDPHVGIVKKGSAYRISCQASIWRPDYLHAIASQCGDTPRDFEINGTKIAESLPDEVLAWKRESEPWPLSYYCSAISRGKWEPAALQFCRQQNIEVDLSLRGVR